LIPPSYHFLGDRVFNLDVARFKGIDLLAPYKRPSARLRGHISVLKERGRDFLGHLLGRAELTVNVFDESAPGWYVSKRTLPSQTSRS
jgi:hypothetical protein